MISGVAGQSSELKAEDPRVDDSKTQEIKSPKERVTSVRRKELCLRPVLRASDWYHLRPLHSHDEQSMRSTNRSKPMAVQLARLHAEDTNSVPLRGAEVRL